MGRVQNTTVASRLKKYKRKTTASNTNVNTGAKRLKSSADSGDNVKRKEKVLKDKSNSSNIRSKRNRSSSTICNKVESPLVNDSISTKSDIGSTPMTDNIDSGKSIVSSDSTSCAANNEISDIFTKILSSRAHMPIKSGRVWKGFHAMGHQSKNITHWVFKSQSGMKCSNRLNQSLQSPVASMISSLRLFRTASPFDRRCTALEWHPTNQNLLCVGSKGGEIILWDINKVNNDVFLPGIGPGGSIQAMKFQPDDTRLVLTASIDGTVTRHDLVSQNRQTLADTLDCHDFWFCSLDVSGPRKLIVTGENTGKVLLMDMDGKQVLSERLHKGKVTHAEFSPREDWLLATASVDKTCKLWDVRRIKDRKSALCTLAHDKPVNSAYFSPLDGTQLLTTDQSSELRVYSAPAFHQATAPIPHPHRFFQHITPIKASWHPQQDLIVVGRYPDPKFPSYTEGERRTIDVIEPGSGETIHQMWDKTAPGIISLTKFNPLGDTLAATMGVNILVWKRDEETEERRRHLVEQMRTTDPHSNSSHLADPHSSRGNKKRSRTKQTKDATKTKLNMKTATETKSKKK